MRKIYSRVSLIVATAVVVFAIAELITASRIAHAQATFPAYTVTTENHIVSGPHVGVLPYVRTIARRSDGARVEIAPVFAQPGIRAGDHVRTIVLPDGYDV